MAFNKKVTNKIIDVISTVIIVLLVICVLSNFQTTFLGKKYNSLFGYALFEVTTGSMSGYIEIGDWIIVKETKDVDVNDVVTFYQDDAIITHRIVESYKNVYVTKGDSNSAKDKPINQDQIIGKVSKILPKFSIIKKTILNEKVLILLFLLVATFYSIVNKDAVSKLITKYKKKFSKEQKAFNKKQEEDEIEIKRIIDKTPISSQTTLLSKVDVDYNNDVINRLQQTYDDDETQEIILPEEENAVVEEVDEMPSFEVNVELDETMQKVDDESNVFIPEDILREDGSMDINVDRKQTRKTIVDNFLLKADQGIDINSDERLANDMEAINDYIRKVKSQEIGKAERNIVKKNIDLKENEIKKYFELFFKEEQLSDVGSIINKFVQEYVNNLYIKQGMYKTSDEVFEATQKEIKKLYEHLITKAKNNKNRKQIEKVYSIMEVIFEFEKSVNKSKNINKIFSNMRKNFENIETIKKNFIKEHDKYVGATNSFNQRIIPAKLDLEIDRIGKTNYYATNLRSTIQFSKIYSDYIINKTYEDDLIMTYLKEAQTSLLSIKISMDMLNINPIDKYIVYYPAGIISKEKKINYILKIAGDEYSQSKLLILIDHNILINCYKKICELKKLGYNFIYEVANEDVEEVAKHKLLISHVLINEEETAKKTKAYRKEFGEEFTYIKRTIKTGVNIK